MERLETLLQDLSVVLAVWILVWYCATSFLRLSSCLLTCSSSPRLCSASSRCCRSRPATSALYTATLSFAAALLQRTGVSQHYTSIVNS